MKNIPPGSLRRYRWPALTEGANVHLASLQSLPWERALPKVLWLGVGFVLLVVGVGRATTVFLSHLVRTLGDSGLPLVTAIFAAVGTGMFLLPPVPGVPVYLAGGVLLTSSAMRAFDDSEGAGGDASSSADSGSGSDRAFLLRKSSR